MRLACLQENFSRGLGIVGRAVGSKTVLPITTHVLLATDKSRLRLTATNLEIAISFWVGAKVVEEGAVAVPADLLTKFVASLPNDQIDISVSPETQTMGLKCANFDAHISGQNSKEFPPVPQIGEGMNAQVEPQSLRKSIEKVSFAASTDDARPVLTGIYMQFSDNKLALAAADGFRLAVSSLTLPLPAQEDMGIIVPARSMKELSRLLRDREEPVEFIVNPQKSQVLFRFQDVELVSQLIQGTFPNYEQLIPHTYNTRAVINVGEFLRALRSASVFARDGGGIIRIITVPGTELSPGKITISSQIEEIGGNTGVISASVEGEESKIAFNGKYLMDVFTALDDERIAMETTASSSPGVFRPLGEGEWIQVIMPMFVQW